MTDTTAPATPEFKATHLHFGTPVMRVDTPDAADRDRWGMNHGEVRVMDRDGDFLIVDPITLEALEDGEDETDPDEDVHAFASAQVAEEAACAAHQADCHPCKGADTLRTQLAESHVRTDDARIILANAIRGVLHYHGRALPIGARAALLKAIKDADAKLVN